MVGVFAGSRRRRCSVDKIKSFRVVYITKAAVLGVGVWEEKGSREGKGRREAK